MRSREKVTVLLELSITLFQLFKVSFIGYTDEKAGEDKNDCGELMFRCILPLSGAFAFDYIPKFNIASRASLSQMFRCICAKYVRTKRNNYMKIRLNIHISNCFSLVMYFQAINKIMLLYDSLLNSVVYHIISINLSIYLSIYALYLWQK